MKYIKKVAVSPIPATSGAVIDSFNATDKTTNAPSIRAVEDKLSYSTEEKVVGEWVDGKPIYKKTIVGAFNNGDVIMSNVDTIVNAYGTMSAGGVWRVIPYYEIYENKSNICTLRKDSDATDVITSIISSGNATSATCKITMLYTKTTD